MDDSRSKSENIEINVSHNDETANRKQNDSPTEAVEQTESFEDVLNGKNENQFLEKLQRLQAEFANYKKRIERERFDLADYLKSEFVSTLLPVLDDLERLLHHSNAGKAVTDSIEILQGIELIYRNLLEVLKKEGLKPIDSVGQKFDPTVHEALLIDPSSHGDYEIVAEEWRKGYFFKDRLIRPAQVKVAKIDTAIEN